MQSDLGSLDGFVGICRDDMPRERKDAWGGGGHLASSLTSHSYVTGPQTLKPKLRGLYRTSSRNCL